MFYDNIFLNIGIGTKEHCNTD